MNPKDLESILRDAKAINAPAPVPPPPPVADPYGQVQDPAAQAQIAQMAMQDPNAQAQMAEMLPDNVETGAFSQELTPEMLFRADQLGPWPKGVDLKWVEQLGGELQRAHTQYEGAWADDRERLWKCFKEYTFLSDRRVSKLYSNLNIPYTFSKIRAATSRQVNAMFSLDPIIRAEPAPQFVPDTGFGEGEMLEEAQADAITQILSSQVGDGPARESLMRLAVDGNMYGRSIAEPGFSFMGDTGNGFPEREGVISPRIAPHCFMADPRCTHVDQAIRTFKALFVTQDMAEQFYQNGLWDKTKVDFMWDGTNPTNAAATFQQRLNQQRKANDVSPTGWETASECILRIDPTKSGEKRFWKVYFNPASGKVFGMRPSTFRGGMARPIVVGCIFPIPDQLYGMSLTELVYAISHATNSALNQWVDNTKWAANARYLIGRNATVVEAELNNSMPGGIVHAGDISEASGIRILQAKSVADEITMLMGFLRSAGDDASAFNPITMGSKAASTAFATGKLASEAEQNIDIMGDFWKVTFLDPLAQAWCDLIQQFQDLHTPVNVQMGGKNMRVLANREDIQGHFTAKFSDMAVAGKRQATAQSLMTLTAMLVQAGLPPGEIAKTVMRYLDIPARDVKKLSAFIDQAMAAQAQQAQMAATAQAGSAPSQPGVPGQPMPVSPTTPKPASASSRLQISAGPGGEMPVDLQAAGAGMALGGGE